MSTKWIKVAKVSWNPVNKCIARIKQSALVPIGDTGLFKSDGETIFV